MISLVMKVSLDLPQTLLYSFLILGTSVFIGILYSRTVQTQVKETFAVSKPDPLLMSDITLQTCPADTNSYIVNGITKCCSGDIVNNVCNGNTICALSDTVNDAPSCQKMLQNKLQEKATQFCPPSLPRYYEDKENPNRKRNEKPMKGCTASNRTPDGKSIIDPKAQRCFIYPTRNENIENANSCYNMRVAQEYKCPSTGKPAQIVNLGNGNVLHSCSFVGTTTEEVKITENIIQNPTNNLSRFASRFSKTKVGQKVAGQIQKTVTRTTTRTVTKPVTCYSEISYNTMLLKNKTPVSNLTIKDDLLNFCSVANRYYIQKSLNDQSFLLPMELQKIKNNLITLINQQEKKYV